MDASWLAMEAHDTPLHVGVLGIFSVPQKAPPDYITQLVEQMREHGSPVAPWQQVVSSGPLTRLAPLLREDTAFDLDYHFRHSALPTPGGERELGIMVSRLHGNPLDRTRPLWECHLVEGLEGGRFAIYLKVHRAILGDISAVPAFLDRLSSSARTRNTPPPWAEPLAEDSEQWWQEALRDFDPVTAATTAGRAALGLLRKSGSFLAPDSAPFSTLNRPIGAPRRFATWQFEQSRIERVAEATDSTVNELLTYLCGSSLRRFFKEYNALPDESLVGLIPVSLQERSSRTPGGAMAGIRVELGTQIGNPEKRLAAVKASIKQVREDRRSLPDEGGIAYSLVRAAPLIISQMKLVGRIMPPLFNVQVSSAVGPDRPRYFNGARLEAIYPMNQLLQYSALSIDCVVYAGTLNIGFCGARDTLPHLQRLAVYLGRALDELEERLESP
jgi:diacylglycerol O-acyltransferase